MHDVIRDMALWIASRDQFLVQARTGLNVVSTREWKNVERISLMGNHIEELKGRPSCHNLITLLLKDNRLNMIGHDFFQAMRNLRVLDLSGNQDLIELPNEISILESLQYLNLSGTGIAKLPVEMCRMKNLRYLDLTYTYYLHTIPIVLIYGFRKLEVLKMIRCGSLKKLHDIALARQLDLIHALERLDNLRDLSITIQDRMALRILMRSKELQCCTRRLGCSHTYVEVDNIVTMKKLERLEIIDCVLRFRGYFPRILERLGFLSLRSVFVVRCSKVRNLTWLGHAKNLEILMIAYCTKMLAIIVDYGVRNSFQSIPFSRLKELYLIELPQLHHVVHYGNGLPFPCLKYIGVEGCPMLIDLALNSDSAKGCGLTIQGEEDWWKKLELKYDASYILTDPNDKKKNTGESSTSTEYLDPKEKTIMEIGESSTLTHYAGAFSTKTMEIGESSTSTSTSTYNTDRYLPYFKSFE